MDSLFLEGLEIPCRVGCTPPERAVPQSLRLDIHFVVESLERAGKEDLLSETVDYAVAGRLISAVQGKEYLLIERVAEELAAVALAEPKVQRVQLTLRKRPPVQGLEIAGVQIVRSRTVSSLGSSPVSRTE